MLSSSARPRIAIIGSGVAGLAAAFRFSQCECSVTLFAPQDSALPSASHIAQGLSAMKGLRLGHTPLFSAKLVGHENLQSWIESVEAVAKASVNWSRGNIYEFFDSEEEHQNLRARIWKTKDHMALGVKEIRPENAKDYREKLSLVEGRLKYGAFYYASDIWIDAKSMLEKLKMASEIQGVEFVDALCEGIEFLPGGHKALLKLNTTKKETEAFDHVIVAVGDQLPGFYQYLGMAPPKFYMVEGHTLAGRVFDQKIAANTSQRVHVIKKTFNYSGLFQSGHHEFIAGSTSWRATSDPDLSRQEQEKSCADLLAQVRDMTGFRLENNADFRFQHGVRLRTKDRNPLIGQLGPNVFLIGALYKNGWQLADIAAKYATEALGFMPRSELSDILGVFSV